MVGSSQERIKTVSKLSPSDRRIKRPEPSLVDVGHDMRKMSCLTTAGIPGWQRSEDDIGLGLMKRRAIVHRCARVLTRRELGSRTTEVALGKESRRAINRSLLGEGVAQSRQSNVLDATTRADLTGSARVIDRAVGLDTVVSQ